MGEKKNLSLPRVLNSRPCPRTLCKCVTHGQGGLWLWVKQFFILICVCSCYWWPRLASATVPQQYYSQTSTNGHNFIAAGFSVSLRPTVHTFSPIVTFVQRQRPPKHVPKRPLQNDQLIKRLTNSLYKTLCYIVNAHKTWSVPHVVGNSFWLISVLLIKFDCVKLGTAMLQWAYFKHKNGVPSEKKTKHITPLPLHSGHLWRNATFACRQD